MYFEESKYNYKSKKYTKPYTNKSRKKEQKENETSKF